MSVAKPLSDAIFHETLMAAFEGRVINSCCAFNRATALFDFNKSASWFTDAVLRFGNALNLKFLGTALTINPLPGLPEYPAPSHADRYSRPEPSTSRSVICASLMKLSSVCLKLDPSGVSRWT